MISEMERLILKADVPGDPKQKNGVGSKGPAASATSRRRSGGTPTASNPTPSSQKKSRDSVSPTPTATSAPTSSTARRMSLLRAPQSTSAAPVPHPVSPHQSLAAEVTIEDYDDNSVPVSVVDLNGGIQGEFLRDKDCDDVTTIHTTTTRESVSAVCSDATSLDDSFDGLTTSDSSIQRKVSLLRPTSFSHNVYGNRIGSDSVSVGESDFLTVPTLYVDDCKSSSKVAKEYLKAISSPRNSAKMSKSPVAGNSPTSGTWSKSSVGSTSSAPKRQSLTSQKGQTTRKFGFIPSPSLSKSLLKVSKDSAGCDGNVSCGSTNSRRISLDKNSRSLIGETDHTHSKENPFDARDRRRSEKENQNMDHSDTATTAALVSMAAAYGKVGKPQDKSSSGNHVLFGVSQMLAILKKHVEKSRCVSGFFHSPRPPPSLGSSTSSPSVYFPISIHSIFLSP